MNTLQTQTDIQTTPANVFLPELVPLAAWEAKAIDWIWQPYVPAGMLTMLSGCAGAGKTYIALAIAAAVTSGRTPGADFTVTQQAPGNVVYLTAANNPALVLRPRFDALGGKARNLRLLRGILDSEGRRRNNAVEIHDLPGVATLEQAVSETSARLLIVDPLDSFLDAAGRSVVKVRRVLDRLSRLAEDCGCGVLLVCDLRKSPRGGMSRVFEPSGPVRSELLAGCDPDEPARRALAHVRWSLGETGPALGYSIGAGGSFAWTGSSPLNAGALMTPPLEPEEKSKVDEAAEFLLRELAGYGAKAREIIELAEEYGIKETTLRRAKLRLKVKSTNYDVFWWWSLPKAEEPNLGADSGGHETKSGS